MFAEAYADWFVCIFVSVDFFCAFRFLLCNIKLLVFGGGCQSVLVGPLFGLQKTIDLIVGGLEPTAAWQRLSLISKAW